MNILYCCNRLPYAETRDAGRQSSYHLINHLVNQMGHSISLITFLEERDVPHVEDVGHLCTEIATIPFDAQNLSGRLWRLACRQLFTKVYGREFHLGYAAKLDQLLKQTQFDVAIIEGVMGIYGRQVTLAGVPAVLDEVDLFASVAYQLYRKAKQPLVRAHLWQDWLRTLSRESHFWRTYAGVLVRSEKDAHQIRGLEPDTHIEIVPTWFEGVASLRDLPAIRPAGNKLLYVGAMGLAPNIEAVHYFADHIFPLIRQAVTDVEWFIVGSQPHASVEALGNRPGITVTGEVDELTPYYEAAAINVVPLRVGGGIIIKTLNGLAAARPTVATSLGNSGTLARDGEDLLIVDPPARFADAVIQLLTDLELWKRYAEAGRRFIEQNYNWEHDISTLDPFLRQIIANTPSNTPKNGDYPP